MREMAVNRPVLVVNSLGLRLPTPGTSSHAFRRIARKLRSTAKLVRRPVPGLPGFHVMTPLLIPVYGDRAGARVSAWFVRQQVRLVARLIGLGPSPHIGVTLPTAWPVVRPMRRASLIFNRSDLHSSFPGTDRSWLLGLEHSLLRHSDRVLYVSHELMRHDAADVGDRAVFLDHGVDAQHFSPDGEIDPEVAAIPKPRMGFFGGLDDYVVDLELLRQTARENHDVSLILVGDATCSMEALTSLPNVHWLGFRPYESIPALGRGFDVALMPWLDNEWIRFANPVKLKEYLALGLPVVTTEYPQVEGYRDRVVVAERSRFPALARRALSAPRDADRLRHSVVSTSWSSQACLLSDIADSAGVA
jgi:glycosyltransferase involved in cell wall biosynthesis